MLRGAISGFGEVSARAHLPGWLSREGVEIVAVHDPVAARRHAAINLIKNIRVYDDFELMLDGEALDFVDLASPPVFHAASARLALEAGANVLVEKPLCLGPGEFDELARVAADASRVLMCVHNWKFAPVYRRARELIDDGSVGVPQYLSLTRLRTEPAGGGGSTGVGGERWRLDPKSGGGILIDHGWHAFYLAQWLLQATPRAVSAHLGFRGSSNLDDFADIRIEFSNGAIAHVHLSWRSPARRTSAIIYSDSALVEIEQGALVISERSGKVSNFTADEISDDSYHAAWFAGVAAAFELAIAQGPSGAISQENLAEARHVTAIIAAARNSAATGGATINLP